MDLPVSSFMFHSQQSVDLVVVRDGFVFQQKSSVFFIVVILITKELFK